MPQGTFASEGMILCHKKYIFPEGTTQIRRQDKGRRRKGQLEVGGVLSTTMEVPHAGPPSTDCTFGGGKAAVRVEAAPAQDISFWHHGSIMSIWKEEWRIDFSR